MHELNPVYPDVDKRAPRTNSGKGRAGEKPRFALVAFDKVVMSTTSFYLVKNLIPRAGLVIVWGAPKCGKSFWTFDMPDACRVLAGRIAACGSKLAPSSIAPSKERKASRTAIDGVPDQTSGIQRARQLSLMFTPLDLIRDHKALIASIRAQLPEGATPVAVAIDTLNRSLVGSENSDEDMAAYVRAADAIHAAFDCVVIVVHHCGHNGDRPRGHSSLLGADDILIAVKRDAADNIVATIENAKDAATGLEIVTALS